VAHPLIVVLTRASRLISFSPNKAKQMRHLYIFLALLLPISAFAQLDNSFDGDGRAFASVGSPCDGNDMLIQPADQYVVVAGQSGYGAGWCLARFTTTGALDPKFGTGGKVTIPFASDAELVKIGIQSNGSIIVAAQTHITAYYIVVFRITNLGQIDYTFNPSGYVQLAQSQELGSLLIQSDDKILLGGITNPTVGWRLTRLTKDGVADGYGTQGTVSATGYQLTGMAFETDGSVIVCGEGTDGRGQAIHVSTTGVLDAHFGSSGYAHLTVNSDAIDILNVSVIPGGDIVLVGDYLPAGTNQVYRILIIELTADGQYNPAFAGNGKLGVPLPGYNATGIGVVQTWSGRLVVAGYAVSGRTSVALCRVMQDGSIDYAFGPNGVQLTSWSNSSYSLGSTAIALQKDAKIVVGVDVYGKGMGVMRYLNPFIIPPPPVVDAQTNPLQNAAANINDASLRLFPNPATQALTIEGLDPNEKTLYQITDVAGHTLLTARPGSALSLSVDISSLAAGTYFLTISSPTRRKTLTFVEIK
jgi:uncharacterized delta-60 repeat protein